MILPPEILIMIFEYLPLREKILFSKIFPYFTVNDIDKSISRSKVPRGIQLIEICEYGDLELLLLNIKRYPSTDFNKILSYSVRYNNMEIFHFTISRTKKSLSKVLQQCILYERDWMTEYIFDNYKPDSSCLSSVLVIAVRKGNKEMIEKYIKRAGDLIPAILEAMKDDEILEFLIKKIFQFNLKNIDWRSESMLKNKNKLKRFMPKINWDEIEYIYRNLRSYYA